MKSLEAPLVTKVIWAAPTESAHARRVLNSAVGSGGVVRRKTNSRLNEVVHRVDAVLGEVDCGLTKPLTRASRQFRPPRYPLAVQQDRPGFDRAEEDRQPAWLITLAILGLWNYDFWASVTVTVSPARPISKGMFSWCLC